MDARCQAHPELLAARACTRCATILCLTCLLGTADPQAPVCRKCSRQRLEDATLYEELRTTGMLRAVFAAAAGALFAVVVYPLTGEPHAPLLAFAAVATPLLLSALALRSFARAWCLWAGVALDSLVAGAIVLLVEDTSTLVFLGMPVASTLQALKLHPMLPG